MIRESIRRRLTLSSLLAVLGLLGGYVLLRGASETSIAAPKTVPTPAPVSAGISQFPAPESSVSQNAISKSHDRKHSGTSKHPTAELARARTSKSSADSYENAVIRNPNQIGPRDASFIEEPANPISIKRAVSSKLSPAPLPQGGSGTTPPNLPTLTSPVNGGTGISTSPTLKVNVSDPNSKNVTVNFYGKVVPSAAPGPSFTIVALPDTQYYSSASNGGTVAMFNSQTQWIVNNRATDNIAFVIGLGDIVQNGNNNGNYLEWVNANSAVSLLDNPATTGLPQGIPYSFGVGNHDQGPNGDGGLPNDTAGYNQYFGISRYSSKSYYGGHYGTQNDNHYEFFSAGGMDFIVINLAYDVNADPNVLAWANGLLQSNSSRRGILVTHYLINEGFNAAWSPQGQATYNALKGNPNLFLMLSGHWTPPEGQRTDVFSGNRVFTIMSDYQDSGSGGDGWMRILTFLPASNQIQVQTYSPFINQSENTSSGNFTVNYDMQGNGNNFTLLASNTGILSGNSTSFTWPGLIAGSQYEWYVTVSNSTGTTVGPLWSFTTAGNPPVTLSPASLNFSSQPVNSTSASQAVTLSNTGNSALSITSIAASAQFGQTNNCPTSPSTLPANSNCTINVTFTPTATGAQSGSITINDNAVGSPQQISLTGTGTTGVAPTVSFSPSSLTFSNPSVAVVQDAATTGSGSSTLAAAFGSKVTKNNLLVVAVSSYAGNAFATTPITDTLASTWTLAVAKNPGTAGTPSLANIYYAVVPSTGSDTVTVHMTGTNSLHLHVYEISGLVTSSVLDQIGSNYQSSATAGTVSTAASTTSANEFVFSYFARDNGSGTWTAGAGYGNPLSSPNTGSGTDGFSEGKIVSAAGTQTATATSSATDALTSVIAAFVAAGGGGTAVGTTSAAQTVTLNNTGSASLSISSIVASGDYGQTNTCGSFVAVGGSCTISVTFSPLGTGTRSGTITITDNAANSPQTVSLTGTGTPASGPVVNLAPASLNFGNQAVNTTSAAQAVTLNNIGSTSLSITSIASSSQYAQTNTCGASIAAGANCTINVTFTPTASGAQAGTITITDNAPGSPHVVNLTGNGSSGNNPAVTMSPASLSFGNQNLNTSSAALPITLTNSGTAALTITNVAASAQYAQTNTCGASVAAGANCTISVTFTPTATGTQAGTITVTDNASGSPHIVNLTGTGTTANGPAVTMSPTSLTFGNQTLNTTSAVQTVSLTNSGNATLTFTTIATSAQYAEDDTCNASLPAGAKCTLSITFTPTATGTQTGTLTIVDNAPGSPHIVNLTGSGIAANSPAVTLSPTGLSFGNQTVNTTSAALPITLTNSGTATLTITNMAASAQYAQTNTCGASVAAGANCTISVKFTPTATGTQTGTITITDNVTGSPQTVNLTGTGTAANAPAVTLAPTGLNFGNQTLNTPSAAQGVTLTNSGTATLTITTTVASAQYGQTNTCGTSVAAGANCAISVTFTPTATGTQAGTITITDNATGSPQTVNLTGIGTVANAPAVTLAPTGLNFGNQTLNTSSAAQGVTLTNSGTASLSITGIAASVTYAQTNTCPASLAAGANCSISVIFTPTATGTQAGTITVTDNASGNPHVVGLTGSGTSGGVTTVSLSPTSLSFSAQQINTTSSSKTVRITNTGSVALSISSIGPSGDFSETNNCGASINPGSHCTVTVRFTPTVGGAETGAITISDNATGSPQTAPLTGTGANISLSPTSLSFGSQKINTTSAAQIVTLTNAGTAALNITKMTTGSQYAQTNTCGTSLAGGTSCTISVTFKPTTTGTHNSTLTITDDATGSTKTVSLAGTGQ